MTKYGASYETIYYSMLELSQRYKEFTNFRILGQTHDHRWIPSLSIGQGLQTIYCLSGLKGMEQIMPVFLINTAELYCKAYESEWILEDFYNVRALLNQYEICFVPLLNPDGYEIYRRGYSAIRNSVYRQLLQMQECLSSEYAGNARGKIVAENFPWIGYKKKKIHDKPLSENESRAFVHLCQERKGAGLMVFYSAKINDAVKKKSIMKKHCTNIFQTELSKARREVKKKGAENGQKGSVECFYTEYVKQPSISLEISISLKEREEEIKIEKYCLPLEYLFMCVEKNCRIM